MEPLIRIFNLKNLIFITLISISFYGCKKDNDGILSDLNLFPLSKDIELGETMDSIIKADPAQYPILDPATNAAAYQFINSMFQKILQSDEFDHRDDFDWKITIINNNSVLNAFAVPGGKLYFYTGIIKYVDDAATLAGVVAHEMAHADRRHSTQQMTKAVGVNVLLSILLGNDKSQLAQLAGELAGGLAELKFSRDDEYEADSYSVKYLADTDYNPVGIKSFFEKLRAEGQTAATFEFLSTHPDDENRINNINDVWASIGSPTGSDYAEEYATFKSLLP
jgi:beta-barrel assembly-enhancing protease